MVSVSWIDFYYLVKEFNSNLLGARIDSFYGNHEELHIKIYKAGQKNMLISSFISKGITLLTQEKNQHNPKNGFVQYLRKYLKNGFIDGINTYPKERIITLKISKKMQDEDVARQYYIHLEHFMGGQIYLCDEDQKILKSLKNINDSKIKESMQYNLPSTDPSFLTKFSIDNTQSLQDNVKYLGIGKKYVKLLSEKFNVSVTDILKTDKELESYVRKLIDNELKPVVFNNEIYPFEGEDSQLFSKLLLEKYSKELYTQQIERKPAKLVKLKKRLKDQEKNYSKIETEEESLQQKGSIFYKQYQLLDEFKMKINTIIDKNGFNGLKEMLKDKKELKQIITSIDEKDKKISINIEKLVEYVTQKN